MKKFGRRNSGGSSTGSGGGSSRGFGLKNPVSGMRTLVSQKKVRYVTGEYDLDLSYITPRIIAMGFPSSGVEKFYRNPLEQVRDFLTEKHPGKYRLYNLCKEKDRTYDETQFQNQVRMFPWYDHSVPPLGMMSYFCKDIEEWLNEDEENIVAIHCKAGKGRTGLAICCYLIWSGKCSNYMDALKYFADKRVMDGKGVTISSQRRFIMYFADLMQHKLKGSKRNLLAGSMMIPPAGMNNLVESDDDDNSVDSHYSREDYDLSEKAKKIVIRLPILSEWYPKKSKKKPLEILDFSWNDKNRAEQDEVFPLQGKLPPKKPMLITAVIVHNGPHRTSGFIPMLRIQCGSKLWDSRDYQKPLDFTLIPYEGFRAMVLKVPNIPVEDETYVTVQIKKFSSNKKKDIACAWIHTSFSSNEGVYLQKEEIDGIARRSKKFPSDFALEIKMKPVDNDEGIKPFTNMLVF